MEDAWWFTLIINLFFKVDFKYNIEFLVKVIPDHFSQLVHFIRLKKKNFCFKTNRLTLNILWK